MDKNELERHIDAIPLSTPNDLERDISKMLDRCGLYYRIFTRRKSSRSCIEKIVTKKYEESESGKKMQDLIGVRIALYFKDDIPICRTIIENAFSIDQENSIIDEAESATFKAERLNLICKLPDNYINMFDASIWNYPIDKTFEVQIRTVFSEGWHEVEHDLRYKNKSDWDPHRDLERQLNGVFATLETCDWAILQIFDGLSYRKYQAEDWSSMLRNHLRIHMDNTNLSQPLVDIFNANKSLAKEFLKVDRKRILTMLAAPKGSPLYLSMDNVVYFINAVQIRNEQIIELTPPLIHELIGLK